MSTSENLRQGRIYLADLGLSFGAEPGKLRPVLVVQTNLLNSTSHPSTVILPITSQLKGTQGLLRIPLAAGEAGLEKDSEVLIEQIRAIDNIRFAHPGLGDISQTQLKLILNRISILLMDFDSNKP
jgi:mRNA interferase MazF